MPERDDIAFHMLTKPEDCESHVWRDWFGAPFTPPITACENCGLRRDRVERPMPGTRLTVQMCKCGNVKGSEYVGESCVFNAVEVVVSEEVVPDPSAPKKERV